MPKRSTLIDDLAQLLARLDGFDVQRAGEDTAVLTVAAYGITTTVVTPSDAASFMWGDAGQGYRFGAAVAIPVGGYGFHVKATTSAGAAAYISGITHAAAWREGRLLEQAPAVPPSPGADESGPDLVKVTETLARWNLTGHELTGRHRLYWASAGLEVSLDPASRMMLLRADDYVVDTAGHPDVGVTASLLSGIIDGLTNIPDE